MFDNEEVLDSLSELAVTLTVEERRQVAMHMVVRKFEKNETIYSEGEEPRNLLCLLEGKVKIYKEGVGGRNQIVRVVRPVEYFGYRAAFSDENYVTGAAAFEASTIAIIPIRLIFSIADRNAHLCNFFIRKLAKALGKSDERTVNLTQKHIRGRLAESILFLKENYGVEEDGCTLSIYLSREDMANLSNMTTSNAIRTLSLFAQEKMIAIDGRKIKIINEDALRRTSEIG
jgi:CRP-like cAMP-binding protein